MCSQAFTKKGTALAIKKKKVPRVLPHENNVQTCQLTYKKQTW